MIWTVISYLVVAILSAMVGALVVLNNAKKAEAAKKKAEQAFALAKEELEALKGRFGVQ